MIRPTSSSLSRKPFVTTARVTKGFRTKIPRRDEIRWCRSVQGPIPAARKLKLPCAHLPAEARRSPDITRAISFLHAHGDTLGIRDPSQLQFVRLWRSGSGTHVRFQQVYQSLPVIGALLDVHLDLIAAVCMVAGVYHGRIRLERPAARGAAITKKDSIRRALEDLGRASRLRAEVKCDQLVYSSRRGFRRVYKIVLPISRPLGNWVYLIDPFRGTILNSYNTMRFAHGRGRVYLTSPIEDPSLTVVTLDRLCSPVELKGAHVVVINEDFPEARSEDGSFLYTPADTHFDEVMAYYHADRVSAFFKELDQSLGKVMAAKGGIKTFVHAGDAMDNAYYDPSTNSICLGDGGGAERLNDLAKEAAVVYHEYTHAVLDRVNPHLKGTEADALHEGYADYFGCSLTDDPQIGEWVVAPAGKPYLRDLTNGKRYPRDLEGEAHADGEIWAGACWDLRSSLGAEKADRLVYESMHYLPEFAHFQDAALGVVQAGESMYSGRDRGRIAEIIEERGLDYSSRPKVKS